MTSAKYLKARLFLPPEQKAVRSNRTGRTTKPSRSISNALVVLAYSDVEKRYPVLKRLQLREGQGLPVFQDHERFGACAFAETLRGRVEAFIR